jgi:hypothetical protein
LEINKPLCNADDDAQYAIEGLRRSISLCRTCATPLHLMTCLVTDPRWIYSVHMEKQLKRHQTPRKWLVYR